MQAWEIPFWGLGGVASAISLYEFGYKRLYKHMVGWKQIHRWTKKLAKEVFVEYKPELIYCSSGPSAIVANLLMAEGGQFVPIYIGLSELDARDDFVPPASHDITVKSHGWTTYIPKGITDLKDKRLLIVEDCVLTGFTLLELIETFKTQGFNANRIKSASLVVTDNAVKKGRAPSFFAHQQKSHDIEFPWGNGTGLDL